MWHGPFVQILHNGSEKVPFTTVMSKKSLVTIGATRTTTCKEVAVALIPNHVS
jgi:hypothetical protein